MILSGASSAGKRDSFRLDFVSVRNERGSVIYESRGGTSDLRLHTSHFLLQTSNFKLQNSDLQSSDLGLKWSRLNLHSWAASKKWIWTKRSAGLSNIVCWRSLGLLFFTPGQSMFLKRTWENWWIYIGNWIFIAPEHFQVLVKLTRNPQEGANHLRENDFLRRNCENYNVK